MENYKYIIVRLKNKIDFILYGIKIGKINLIVLIINVFILGYSLSEYKKIMSEKSVFVIILLVFINIIWQIISTIQDYYLYIKQTKYYSTDKSKLAKNFLIDEDINKEYKELYISETGNTIIYSERINSILNSNISIKMKLSKKKQKNIEKYIKTYKDILLPFLNYKWHEIENRKGLFYNEKKLCMASEIVQCENEYIVFVNKSSYYNSYLTNNIYNIRMSHQNGLYIEAPLNSKNYPIRALDVCYMSNHIGVSTIAVSTDGYAIMLRHNNRTAMFTDKLLPTGSGSMDFADMHNNSDLKKCIIKAVERELQEETGILSKSTVLINTKILGFYRDLNRGGKPEFCCISHLNCNRFELLEIIQPSILEQREDIKRIQIIENNKLIHRTIDDLLNSLKAEDKEWSLSLYMNFLMLYKYYHNHK
ncbi:MAG: hypothetical protein J1F40_07235 [Prevotellaceae bacterium]|nr:hypothetical protein [Prevotellaceae bacterium]